MWLAVVLDSCVNQHTFGLLLALCLQLMLACVACIGAGFCVNQHAFGLLLALCLQLMLACVACIGAAEDLRLSGSAPVPQLRGCVLLGVLRRTALEDFGCGRVAFPGVSRLSGCAPDGNRDGAAWPFG